MSRSRNYTFTVNNYTDDDLSILQDMECKYLVYGREVGDSGTPHLQGTICFSTLKTLKAVSKLIPRAHLEQCVALEQSIEYCKKEGQVFEKGTKPATQKEKGILGKRVYEDAWELAKSGDVDSIHPSLRFRYYSTIKRIQSDYQVVPPQISELDFHWWYGPTGTGKSRTARSENPDAFIKNTNKWWCGYKGQSCVIIEEWSPSHECLADKLKQWLDHHPFNAETKGGSMCIRPPKIIITSNYKLEDCFTKTEDYYALERRLKMRLFHH